MLRTKPMRLLTALALTLTLCLIGCGGGGGQGGGINKAAALPSSEPTTPTPPTPTPPTPSANTGALTVFVTDATAPAVLAFSLDLTGASVESSSGTQVTLLDSVTRFELRHLQLAPTVGFDAITLTAGDYTSVTLGFANPQLTTVKPDGTPLQVSLFSDPKITLANPSLTVPVTFSVSTSGNASLLLDWDLRSSLTVDANGNYVFDPVVRASSAATTSGVALRQVAGKVTSAAEGNAFNVELLPSALVVQLTTDASTIFDPAISGLSALKVGDTIEFDADFQGARKYLAKVINPVTLPPNGYEGVITAVRDDATGQSVQIVVQK